MCDILVMWCKKSSCSILRESYPRIYYCSKASVIDIVSKGVACNGKLLNTLSRCIHAAIFNRNNICILGDLTQS